VSEVTASFTESQYRTLMTILEGVQERIVLSDEFEGVDKDAMDALMDAFTFGNVVTDS